MNDYTQFGNAELEGWSEPATAQAYADGFAAAAQQCTAQIVRAAKIGERSKALDVCCGQGIVAAGLAAAGSTVTGLDFSPAMLEIARERVGGVEFIEGDATQLPFEDGCFDAVTMGFGILHIPDSEAAIREAHRVLKPGGRFVYSVWHSPDKSMAFRTVFGAIEKFGDPQVSLPPGPPLHAYADPDFAFPILEAAGFSNPKLETADSYWRITDPGQPYDFFIEGTVRGALLLRAQPAENAAAIRAAVVEEVKRELGAQGPWEVPIPAAVVSAQAGGF